MQHHYKKIAVSFLSVIQNAMLVLRCFCCLQSFEFRADIYSTCFQGIKIVKSQQRYGHSRVEIIYCGEKRKNRKGGT